MLNRSYLKYGLSTLLLVTALFIFKCATTTTNQPPQQDLTAKKQAEEAYQKKMLIKLSFGYEYFKQENYPKAKEYFLQVVKLDTSGQFGKKLYKPLGYTYLRLSAPDSAEWAYKLGISRKSKDPWLRQQLIYIYKNQHRYDKAIEHCQALIEIEPDSSAHHVLLGDLYMGADDKETAIEAYFNALSINPYAEETLRLVTKLEPESERSIPLLEKYLTKNSSKKWVRLELAKCHLSIGEYKKAIIQLDSILTKETINLEVWETMGQTYFEMGNYTKAIHAYKKCLKIDPNIIQNYCNLGQCYIQKGSYSESISSIERALKHDPDNGLAWITYGILFETVTDRCVDNREDNNRNYYDKLMYELAYLSYRKAQDDFTWKAEAENRASQVEPFIPTASDKFMNKNKIPSEDPCYSWALENPFE